MIKKILANCNERLSLFFRAHPEYHLRFQESRHLHELLEDFDFFHLSIAYQDCRGHAKIRHTNVDNRGQVCAGYQFSSHGSI